MNPGNLTIVRNGNSMDSGAHLTVRDERSGEIIVSIECSMEALSRALLGEGRVPCAIAALAAHPDRLGKTLVVEDKTVELRWNTAQDSSVAELRRQLKAAAELEHPGWEAILTDSTRVNKIANSSQSSIYRLSMRRWVPQPLPAHE